MKSSAEKFLERELDKSNKELDRLRAINAELVMALERIADSVALGSSSRQMSNSMRNIFLSIEDAARAAIAKATK